jgi:hypothetical protein
MMHDYGAMERLLRDTLNFRRRPVAVTFREVPPAGVATFTGTEPSGCSFWRIAAGGRSFYTVPSDHHNCAGLVEEVRTIAAANASLAAYHRARRQALATE